MALYPVAPFQRVRRTSCAPRGCQHLELPLDGERCPAQGGDGKQGAVLAQFQALGVDVLHVDPQRSQRPLHRVHQISRAADEADPAAATR